MIEGRTLITLVGDVEDFNLFHVHYAFVGGIETKE